MKKIFVFFLTIMLHCTTQSDELTRLWNDFDHEIRPALSNAQQLQLQYLSDELKKLKSVLQAWTGNKDILALLEMMELAVLQSSPETQTIFEEKIIQIFKQFNIPVYFNKNGLIEKINQITNLPHQAKHVSKKLNFHHTSTAKPKSQKSKKPEKIKGANRTRKKLEKAWKERKEAEKRAAQEAELKRNALQKSKESTAADHFAQTVWDREMERHMKILSPEKKSPEHEEIIGEI